MSGHGHGQIQLDALQHIDQDAQFAPDVQHEDSHKGKQVLEVLTEVVTPEVLLSSGFASD